MPTEKLMPVLVKASTHKKLKAMRYHYQVETYGEVVDKLLAVVFDGAAPIDAIIARARRGNAK